MQEFVVFWMKLIFSHGSLISTIYKKCLKGARHAPAGHVRLRINRLIPIRFPFLINAVQVAIAITCDVTNESCNKCNW